jgi:hypothetical protein
MGLRSDWQTKKKESEDKFKAEHAKELLQVHTQGLTPYPLKFDLKLGPTLDDLEKAQKANKPADVTKYKTAVQKIVGQYKTRISGKTKELGGAKKALDEGISRIEKATK